MQLILCCLDFLSSSDDRAGRPSRKDERRVRGGRGFRAGGRVMPGESAETFRTRGDE